MVGMLNKLLNSRENGKNKSCPIQYVARQPSSIEQVQYLECVDIQRIEQLVLDRKLQLEATENVQVRYKYWRHIHLVHSPHQLASQVRI